jgi:ribonuclease P protein subunit POP4
MALTPETLTRHELAGLQVAVVDAPNPDLVGITGRVVRETMRTLCVAGAETSGDGPSVADGSNNGPSVADTSDDGRNGVEEVRVRQVPKRGSTFEFELPAGSPERTDEAAGVAKAPGTAPELRSDTAGGFDAGQSGRCQGAAYVTVDGTRLLSRPARRTEQTGDSLWR